MHTIAGCRCRGCGLQWVPPRERCPSCADAVSDAPLAAVGRLLTWTVVHAPPSGFEPGYAVGLVELPATRVLARADSAEGLHVGAEVLVVDEAGRLAFRLLADAGSV